MYKFNKEIEIISFCNIISRKYYRDCSWVFNTPFICLRYIARFSEELILHLINFWINPCSYWRYFNSLIFSLEPSNFAKVPNYHIIFLVLVQWFKTLIINNQLKFYLQIRDFYLLLQLLGLLMAVLIFMAPLLMIY